jgi:hypothetical protein
VIRSSGEMKATDVSQRVWSNPSLRANIVAFLPKNALPRLLTLSRSSYTTFIESLYYELKLIDWMDIKDNITSYVCHVRQSPAKLRLPF